METKSSLFATFVAELTTHCRQLSRTIYAAKVTNFSMYSRVQLAEMLECLDEFIAVVKVRDGPPTDKTPLYDDLAARVGYTNRPTDSLTSFTRPKHLANITAQMFERIVSVFDKLVQLSSFDVADECLQLFRQIAALFSRKFEEISAADPDYVDRTLEIRTIRWVNYPPFEVHEGLKFACTVFSRSYLINGAFDAGTMMAQSNSPSAPPSAVCELLMSELESNLAFVNRQWTDAPPLAKLDKMKVDQVRIEVSREFLDLACEFDQFLHAFAMTDARSKEQWFSSVLQESRATMVMLNTLPQTQPADIAELDREYTDEMQDRSLSRRRNARTYEKFSGFVKKFYEKWTGSMFARHRFLLELALKTFVPSERVTEMAQKTWETIGRYIVTADLANKKNEINRVFFKLFDTIFVRFGNALLGLDLDAKHNMTLYDMLAFKHEIGIVGGGSSVDINPEFAEAYVSIPNAMLLYQKFIFADRSGIVAEMLPYEFYELYGFVADTQYRERAFAELADLRPKYVFQASTVRLIEIINKICARFEGSVYKALVHLAAHISTYISRYPAKMLTGTGPGLTGLTTAFDALAKSVTMSSERLYVGAIEAWKALVTDKGAISPQMFGDLFGKSYVSVLSSEYFEHELVRPHKVIFDLVRTLAGIFYRDLINPQHILMAPYPLEDVDVGVGNMYGATIDSCAHNFGNLTAMLSETFEILTDSSRDTAVDTDGVKLNESLQQTRAQGADEILILPLGEKPTLPSLSVGYTDIAYPYDEFRMTASELAELGDTFVGRTTCRAAWGTIFGEKQWTNVLTGGIGFSDVFSIFNGAILRLINSVGMHPPTKVKDVLLRSSLITDALVRQLDDNSLLAATVREYGAKRVIDVDAPRRPVLVNTLFVPAENLYYRKRVTRQRTHGILQEVISLYLPYLRIVGDLKRMHHANTVLRQYKDLVVEVLKAAAKSSVAKSSGIVPKPVVPGAPDVRTQNEKLEPADVVQNTVSDAPRYWMPGKITIVQPSTELKQRLSFLRGPDRSSRDIPVKFGDLRSVAIVEALQWATTNIQYTDMTVYFRDSSTPTTVPPNMPKTFTDDDAPTLRANYGDEIDLYISPLIFAREGQNLPANGIYGSLDPRFKDSIGREPTYESLGQTFIDTPSAILFERMLAVSQQSDPASDATSLRGLAYALPAIRADAQLVKSMCGDESKSRVPTGFVRRVDQLLRLCDELEPLAPMTELREELTKVPEAISLNLMLAIPQVFKTGKPSGRRFDVNNAVVQNMYMMSLIASGNDTLPIYRESPICADTALLHKLNESARPIVRATYYLMNFNRLFNMTKKTDTEREADVASSRFTPTHRCFNTAKGAGFPTDEFFEFALRDKYNRKSGSSLVSDANSVMPFLIYQLHPLCGGAVGLDPLARIGYNVKESPRGKGPFFANLAAFLQQFDEMSTKIKDWIEKWRKSEIDIPFDLRT